MKVTLSASELARIRDGETFVIESSDLGPDGHNGTVEIECGNPEGRGPLVGFKDGGVFR